MTTDLQSSVNALLSTVFDPRLGPAPGRDLVSAKMVGEVAIKDGALSVEIVLPYAAMGEESLWKDRVSRALAGVGLARARPLPIWRWLSPQRGPVWG